MPEYGKCCHPILFFHKHSCSYLHSDIEIGVIGGNVDLTYDYHYLGNSSSALDSLLEGRSEFSKVLQSAKQPLVIVGIQALQGEGAELMQFKLQQLANKIRKNLTNSANPPKVLNVLHENAAQVAAFDLGYRPFNQLDSKLKKSIKLLYLLGADDRPINRKEFHEDLFVIYQGHHGDAGAENADMILPGATYTEKEATWVNTEGRAQRGYPAVLPPGDARDDWKIIRALGEVAGRKLPYDNIVEIRHRLSEVAPHLTRYGEVEAANYLNQAFALAQDQAASISSSSKATKQLEPRQKSLPDYWLTNSITRASPTMVQCVKAAKNYAVQPHTDPLRLANPHA